MSQAVSGELGSGGWGQSAGGLAIGQDFVLDSGVPGSHPRSLHKEVMGQKSFGKALRASVTEWTKEGSGWIPGPP